MVATLDNQHIVPEMSFVIDDGIKASLATLDLVKYSYSSRVAEKALSDDEVESAHRSLNQIIQAAESIKQKLPSSFINEEIDVIALSSKLRLGSERHDRSITEPSSEGVLLTGVPRYGETAVVMEHAPRAAATRPPSAPPPSSVSSSSAAAAAGGGGKKLRPFAAIVIRPFSRPPDLDS